MVIEIYINYMTVSIKLELMFMPNNFVALWDDKVAYVKVSVLTPRSTMAIFPS